MKIKIADRLATLSNSEIAVKDVSKLIQVYATDNHTASQAVDLIMNTLKDFIIISANLEFQVIISRYLGYLYVLHEILLSAHPSSPLLTQLVTKEKLVEIIDELLRKHRRYLVTHVEQVVHIWKEKDVIVEALYGRLMKRFSRVIFWPSKPQTELKCVSLLSEIGLSDERDHFIYQRLQQIKKWYPDKFLKLQQKLRRLQRANESFYKLIKSMTHLEEYFEKEDSGDRSDNSREIEQFLGYSKYAEVQVKTACSEVVNLQKVAFEEHEITVNCLVLGRKKEAEHIDELTVKPLPKRKIFFGLDED